MVPSPIIKYRSLSIWEPKKWISRLWVTTHFKLAHRLMKLRNPKIQKPTNVCWQFKCRARSPTKSTISTLLSSLSRSLLKRVSFPREAPSGPSNLEFKRLSCLASICSRSWTIRKLGRPRRCAHSHLPAAAHPANAEPSIHLQSLRNLSFKTKSIIMERRNHSSLRSAASKKSCENVSLEKTSLPKSSTTYKLSPCNAIRIQCAPL